MLGDKLLLPLLASLTIVPLTLAQTGNFTIYAYDTGSLICHCSILKVDYSPIQVPPALKRRSRMPTTPRPVFI
ncbi:hypothetical protein DPV78_007211 [Talaromyces pinophilus]|nr:hypothetical protein DPV78_007211 [Talaromyces pinophilus]